ncbi:MAG TPA: CARDB domain-containing protein [Prolixibacteraceae bacterium]|nr:CARDB domain-containing protein [Prolixibacteraceae bacterium]
MKKLFFVVCLMLLLDTVYGKNENFAPGKGTSLSSESVGAFVEWALPVKNPLYARTDDLPNLEAYKPVDREAPLYFNKVRDATTGEYQFLNTASFFMTLSYANTSNLPTGRFTVLVLINQSDTLWIRNVESTNGNHSFGFLNITVGPFDPGEYTMELIVNTNNEVAESDESDNRYSVRITVLDDPNAFVNLAPFTPAGWSLPLYLSHFAGSLQPDFVLYNSRDLLVNMSFTNTGNIATDSFHYMLIIEEYDTLWSFQMGPILVNRIRGLNDGNIGRLPPGNYILTLILDSENTLTESDETDNRISFPFTVSYDPLNAPNLAVYGPEAWDAPLVVANQPDASESAQEFLETENLYLGFGCSNPGEIPVGAFTVSVFNNETGELVTRTLPELLPGTFHYWPNIDIGYFSPGDYTLSLRVDAENQVPESDEQDNIHTVSFRVLHDPALLPNLAPFALPESEAALIVSNETGAVTGKTEFLTTDTLRISYSGHNTTDNPAGSFAVFLTLNETETLHTENREQLGAGESFSLQDFPIGSLEAGQYTLSLLIDPDDQVLESDETDNTLSVTFSVSEPTIEPGFVPEIRSEILKAGFDPSNRVIWISRERDTPCSLVLFNTQGQVVTRIGSVAGSRIHLPARDLPAGIYCLLLNEGRQSQFGKIRVGP